MQPALQLVDTNATATPQAESEPEFADFWLLYPKRVAKKDATRAWAKLSASQKIDAICACVTWRRVWAQKDVEYLPHAATWINGERWEDELPPEYRATSASHVAAALPEQTKRTEMPQNVRDYLAKLRSRA